MFLLFLVFAGTIVGGLLLQANSVRTFDLFAENRAGEKPFHFGHYCFFLFFPLLATGAVVHFLGFVIVKIFIASAAVGTVTEWLLDWTFHRIFGKRLWTYNFLPISEYTSWISIPLWGVAGILFFLLGSVVK